ncbi:MAG: class I SAM-dependent methyltransferase [Acidimicrobiales bacterium]
MRARANRAAQAFEDLAERYDAWYDTAPGRVLFDLELGAIRPLFAGTAGPRLEVGVGSGRFAAALRIEVGLDPAEMPLRVAKARGVRVLRGVGDQLPFADDTFGAVALVVTLCFVEDPVAVLAEVGRVLRSGGRLVVGLVPLDSAWGRSYEEKGRAGHPFYHHARFQTLAGHRLMLAVAGFRIVEARSTLFQAPSDEPVAEPVRSGAVGGAGFVALAAQRASAGAD